MQARPIEIRQRAQHGDDLTMERDAFAGGKLECAADTALTQTERGLKHALIHLMAVADQRRPHRLPQLLGSER